MDRLHVIGVRHHSPACAQLVRHTIATVRPKYVLIEGPADMNGRIGELLLDHTLPIAVFSFHRDEVDRIAAAWSPFCVYSPEWQALVTAREVGAEPLFMDLPSWDKAFLGVHNRYGDHERRHTRAVADLCKRFSIEGYDALWDHLFEGPCDDFAALRARLEAYFQGVRGDAPGGERDGPREEMMRGFIGAALAKTDAPVVVVCGGYHAPALREPPPRAEWPEISRPAGAQSYVVPWSYHRLDSFTGYEAGMPSPELYHAVFTLGAREAPMTLLRVIVARLRAAKQHVSSADLVSAVALAEGLARVRGHDSLRRTDLLDGLASALVKQPLDAPLPWSERGYLRRETDAMLVEILKAISGDREGRLAPTTPLPPLVKDVEQELERVGIAITTAARVIKLSLTTPEAIEKSRVLHRLRLLEVPGITRSGGAAWPTDADLDELWTVVQHNLAVSALVEASRFGATLTSAAARKLEEALAAPDVSLDAIAAILGEAVRIGIGAVTDRALFALRLHAGRETDLAKLGLALDRVLDLFGGDVLFGAKGATELAQVIREIYTRGLWLLEQVSGGSAPTDGPRVGAVRALRTAASKPATGVNPSEATAVFSRRAVASDAPRDPGRLLRRAVVARRRRRSRRGARRSPSCRPGDLRRLSRRLVRARPRRGGAQRRRALRHRRSAARSNGARLSDRRRAVAPGVRIFSAAREERDRLAYRQAPRQGLRPRALEARRRRTGDPGREAHRPRSRGVDAEARALRMSTLERWRLVLGEAGERSLGGLSQQGAQMDAVLQWLYHREEAGDGRGVQSRQGGNDPSTLSVPDWIDAVHRLFPKETIERLERDAVERYQIHEIVTRPEVLKRAQPSETLLRAVLQTKHLMNPEVLALARDLVKRVVDELLEKMRARVREAFAGKRNRNKRTLRKNASSFDFKTTLQRNLKRYDKKLGRVIIEHAHFHTRSQKQMDRWQVILLVDQSGSMVSSVIHSAITAACLYSIPGVDPALVAFDTNVVDFTGAVSDPVELLMRVQLGGGTDIAKAVSYGAGLVKAPRRTIVILVTDFYEGGSSYALVQEVRGLVEQGTIVLGLAALDEAANPAYDRETAQRLADVGAHIGAMTPGQLANFVAEKVTGR